MMEWVNFLLINLYNQKDENLLVFIQELGYIWFYNFRSLTFLKVWENFNN